MRNYLKYAVVLILVAAVLALSGLSCGGGEETIQKGDTYKIGAVFSVTGPYSPLGEPEKQTVEMMMAQINEAGGINGHRLEVIVYDDESDTTKAATLATRLIEQDKVLAIVGPTASGTSMAMVPVATDAHIPLIACAASEPIVHDEKGNVREWIFMTPQSSNQAARTIFGYLQERLNISKVAILTDKAGFGQMGVAALEAEAPKYGITIVAKQTFDNVNDKDMTPQLNIIENASPEAIICWGTSPGPAIITKNWADKKMGIPLIQSHGSLSNTYLQLSGSAANGVMLPSGKFWVADQLPDDDPQKAVLLKYIADFEALYGQGKANTYGGHAYDALSMVIMALREMDDGLTISEARTSIRDYIQNITDFVGTGGIFNMSPENHHGLTDEAMVMVQVVDGKWTWLK
jgi:branched-chain amino acid transport system substrate-binding protein